MIENKSRQVFFIIIQFKQMIDKQNMSSSETLPYKSYLVKVTDDILTDKIHRSLAKSNKMRPFIAAWRDELILQQTDKNSFKKGAILLIKQETSSHLVHRLVHVDGDNLKLRGDAHHQLIANCRRNDVIAEVVAVVRKGKVVKKKTFAWSYYYYLSRIYYFLIFVKIK